MSMICPDCNMPMTWRAETLDKNGDVVMLEYIIWKCPKCKIEIEEEEDE